MSAAVNTLTVYILEQIRYHTLYTSLSRLGGTELGAYHELGQQARVDARTPVASSTMVKRVCGEAAVAGLRKQLV